MAKKKKMNLKPLDDRVVVERIEAEEKSAGGILLPDSAQEKPSRGIVVAAGPGKLADNGKRIELDVAVGDDVLFGRYGGNDVKVDGVDYVIMRESDILGRIV